jgi:UDPglucose 6-dehydrogenase
VRTLKQLYAAFEGVDIVETNCRTAEMIKYASNSLLATMISFANEIGNLCAAVGGIDVKEVTRGVHLDKRLSPILPGGRRIVPGFTTYIEAGCGFGGSCFPKDVNALIAYGAQKGQPMRLLESVMAVNAVQYREVMARLYKHFPSLDAVNVTVLGLAFKPGTDDMRESPAIPIVRELLAARATVKAFDPVATQEARKLFAGAPIEYCDTLASAIDGAHAIVLLTRWSEFDRLIDLLSRRSSAPLVVDGRRMLDRRKIERYEGIGL